MVRSLSLFVALCFVFASCEISLAPSGHSGLRVQLAHGQARFLSPDFVTGTLTGLGPNDTSFTRDLAAGGGTVSIDNLIAGTWTVNVELRNAVDTVLQTGTRTVEVAPGTMAEVSLTLAAPTAGGTPVWSVQHGSNGSETQAVLSDLTGGLWVLMAHDNITSLDHFDSTGGLLTNQDLNIWIMDVCRAPDGSIYAVGTTVSGVADLGNDVSAGSNTWWGQHGLVVHYSPEWKALAAWTMDTNNDNVGNTYLRQVTCDPDGNVYVRGELASGPFTGATHSFTPEITLPAGDGGGGFFVFSLSKDLVPRWAKALVCDDTANGTWLLGMAYGNDSLYVSGGGNGPFHFGSTAYTGTLINFNARYSLSGDELALKVGLNSGEADDIGVSPSGRVYSTWQLVDHDVADFGNSVTAVRPASSPSGTEGLVVEFDANLKALANFGTPAGVQEGAFRNLAFDGDGSLFVAGFLQSAGTVDLGNSVSVDGTNGKVRPILFKLSAEGVPQWANLPKTSDSTSYGWFHTVLLDGSGRVTATGFLSKGNLAWGSLDPRVDAFAGAGSQAILVQFE